MGHRLVAGGGEVEDGQAALTERQKPARDREDFQPFVVGAAMDLGGGHGGNAGFASACWG